MARESLSHRSARAQEVLGRLDGAMPEARIELDYRTPLELLVAVLLSAQSTDKGVNRASGALFERFTCARDYADATPAQIEPYIKTIGLYRNKAKHLAALGRELVERFGGEVPVSREVLATLPGVGLKTAGVVSMHLPGGQPAFPVDTHILRLSNRLGFSTQDDPDKVEADMRRLVPEAGWFRGHQLLIWHGRRVCHARTSPECHRCVVEPVCPKRGVPKKTKAARPRR